MKKKISIIGSIIIVFIVIAIALIALGMYPVLKVNGQWVSQRTLEDRIETSRTLFAAQGVDNIEEILKEQGTDLTLGILEGIIDEYVMNQAAGELIDNVDEEIDRRVSEVMAEADIERVVEESYGITFEAFREQVLIPAAIIDIVRDVVGEEAVSQYLTDKRGEATVSVYIVPYRWEGGMLVAK